MITQKQADEIKRLADKAINLDGPSTKYHLDLYAYILSLVGKDEPFAYAYEWNTWSGAVHRSFNPSPLDGRPPDRSIPLYAAPQPVPPSIPAGWRLVPEEPTDEMQRRGGHANSEWLNDNAPLGESRYAMPMKSVYAAMLAAAPQPTVQAPPECKTDDEKRAYCFGWWKALETVQQRKPMPKDEILRGAREDAGISAYGEEMGDYTIPVPAMHARLVMLARAIERFHGIGDEA